MLVYAMRKLHASMTSPMIAMNVFAFGVFKAMATIVNRLLNVWTTSIAVNLPIVIKICVAVSMVTSGT